ncbi:MAG: DegQ family serine endoprotease [Nitrospira sp.]|nr:DegQ family serine endoprotease [bacterium]MBL7049235.1 DegQ family serine endoprotease [Nitrospira sp.]
MSKNKNIAALIFLTAGLIIGLGISINYDAVENGYSEETGAVISEQAVDVLSRTNNAMAELVSAVKPSIVNISSTKTIRTHGTGGPFFNDPFFNRFFGDQFGQLNRPREHKQSGTGSGVIVDKDGYILTNNHVVQDADEILVKLSDKSEYKGKVIGADPKTDLAVIKIDNGSLPAVKIGDSDSLKVGETVIAIGNPYGLSQTVTSGIVSAKGRANVGVADYEDFIQTDAPINPGNSGGALVNVKGELIGINTAIFSTSGGYQGIGFAIPSNMARAVMKSLIKEGKVIRGWLGVSIQTVSEEMAVHFKLKDQHGALVAEVVEDSPAEKAGILRGDVIIQYDGKTVNDADHLKNMVAMTMPETKVNALISRDGAELTLMIEIGELSSKIQMASGEFDYDNVLSGVSVQDITPELKRSLNIPQRVSGVMVSFVSPESGASGALIQQDVIVEINRRNIRNADEYRNTVSKIRSGDGVLLLLIRNGSAIYLTLRGK